MASSVDPDQTPRSVASDLRLNCLHRSGFPNTLSKYDNMIKLNSLRNHPESAPVYVVTTEHSYLRLSALADYA